METALWWPHPLFPSSLHLPLSSYPITLRRITLVKNCRWLAVAFQLIISVTHSVFHLFLSCTCSPSLLLSLFIIVTEIVIPLYSRSHLTKNKSRFQFSFLSLLYTKLPLVYGVLGGKKDQNCSSHLKIMFKKNHSYTLPDTWHDWKCFFLHLMHPFFSTPYFTSLTVSAKIKLIQHHSQQHLEE